MRLRLEIALVFAVACEAPPPFPPPSRREVFGAVVFVQKPAKEPPARIGDGSRERPFATIAEAVRSAPAGALVRVEDGVYEEDELLFRRPLTIAGRGPSRTRIVARKGARGPLIAIREAGLVELRSLAVEGGMTGIVAEGGSLRLESVALRGQSEVALSALRAEVVFAGGEIIGVGEGGAGPTRGIGIQGGSLYLRQVVLRSAGKRAIRLEGTRALLEALDAQGPGMAALQAVDGADVRVERGRFARFSGAALYAGAAKLAVHGARVSSSEYAVIAFRGARISLEDDELTDTQFAAVGIVKAGGRIERCLIARGGTEGGVSITEAQGVVRLVQNRILDPGPMGVHVTHSAVIAQGNTVSGSRLDREGDLGDAFYAIDSELSLDRNALRGNAGSGISLTRSKLRLTDTTLAQNGRAGLLLLDDSQATASGSSFERNRGAGVELDEGSRATLSGNRFAGNEIFDIDVACSSGSSVDVRPGNTYGESGERRRTCF